MLLYDRHAVQNRKKKRERQAEASLFDPLRARRHEDDGSESGRIENRPCT